MATNFREVPGFPDYRVGDDGSVWSRKNPNGRGVKFPWRKMKPWPNLRGYLCVTLTNGPKRSAPRVHGLVLLAFVGPKPIGMESLHGPNGKADNSLANLRYGTKLENAADTLRDGTRRSGERHPMAKLSVADVEVIRQSAKTVKSLATEFNVSRSQIKAIRSNRKWKVAHN